MIKNNSVRYFSHLLTLLVLTLSLFSSCEKSDSGETSASAQIKTSEFSSTKNSSVILIDAPIDTYWSAQVTEGDDFVSFKIDESLSEISNVVSNAVSTKMLYFYVSANETTSAREAIITLKLDNQPALKFTISQKGSTTTGGGSTGGGNEGGNGGNEGGSEGGNEGGNEGGATSGTLPVTLFGGNGLPSSASSGTFTEGDITFVYEDLYYNSQYGSYSIPSGDGFLSNQTEMENLRTIVVTEDYQYYNLVLYVGKTSTTTSTKIEYTKSRDEYIYSIPEGNNFFKFVNESEHGASADKILFSSEENYEGSGSEDVVNDDFGVWTETPTVDNDDDNNIYVTHYTTLSSGEKVRNYSLCFDKENRAATWVAYPYHKIYDGHQNRTNKWDYDPKIPAEYQPNLDNSYDGNYDRGHQLPSADRLATYEMNAQTFYYSNMTPQLGTLNQQKWATIEGEVRDQVCSDTLYVVTGADFTKTIGVTYDKDGVACPLARGYYKVMLRTISGNSGKAISECKASELKAIGFYFEHKYYSTVPEPVSVSYIEEKTGLEFFPNIPKEVKENFKASQWSF